jgi:hypothetical protein
VRDITEPTDNFFVLNSDVRQRFNKWIKKHSANGSTEELRGFFCYVVTSVFVLPDQVPMNEIKPQLLALSKAIDSINPFVMMQMRDYITLEHYSPLAFLKEFEHDTYVDNDALIDKIFAGASNYYHHVLESGFPYTASKKYKAILLIKKLTFFFRKYTDKVPSSSRSGPFYELVQIAFSAIDYPDSNPYDLILATLNEAKRNKLSLGHLFEGLK